MNFCAKVISYPLAYPKAQSLPASVLQQELAAAADACNLVDSVRKAVTAVCLMIKSLARHPLSQRLPAEVSGGLLASEGTLTAEDIKTGLCGPKSTTCTSTQEQIDCQPDKWPFPEPNEWQDVQLVAVRAFTTVDWAVSTLGAAHPAVTKRDSLIGLLCYLLERLLAGHLPDLDLDVQELFKIGLQPVLDAELDGHAESEGLAAMMLSRLAIDSRFALQGRACARQICYIFGESSQ